jgi:transposase
VGAAEGRVGRGAVGDGAAVPGRAAHGGALKALPSALWRLRSGAPWRAVPPGFGPRWKAAQLHIRWSRAGVWEHAFASLRDAGRPELGEVFLDGTSIRAHQKAAGAKGGGGGARARPLARRLRHQGLRGLRRPPRPPARLRPPPPGQASELRAAPLLLGLAALLGAVLRVVCDASYSSARWLASIRALGAEPVVRPNPTHRSAPAHDRAAYRRRHRIENLWARLKEWRAVATRYDKAAASFLGGLHLAAAFEWLSKCPSGNRLSHLNRL